MNTTPDLHYQNANFLRELAEKLPRISPEDGCPEHCGFCRNWLMSSWQRHSTSTGYVRRLLRHGTILVRMFRLRRQ